MMAKGDRKTDYFTKVNSLFRQYSKIFTVGVDNVTSAQLQKIRASIRDDSVILMGKNTMIRKVMRELSDELPDINALYPYIKGNTGLVFTNGDLKTVRDAMLSHRVAAPAKAAAIAQSTVTIPAGNTGIAPDKTSFFQTLGIPTKVVKGAIEIINDVVILKEGEKVGASEAELLTMLNITPFQYGLVVHNIYDNGAIFSPTLLDVTEESLMKIYNTALNNVAALSLRISFPTVAAVPHTLINGFKNLLAVSLSTDYTFPASEKLKEAIANPQMFSAPAATKTETAPQSSTTSTKVEEAEESDEEMGFGLFD